MRAPHTHLVISTMRAMAVRGALQAAPSTAAAPTTTRLVGSDRPQVSATKWPMMSPTSAPRNREGANRPPTCRRRRGVIVP